MVFILTGLSVKLAPALAVMLVMKLKLCSLIIFVISAVYPDASFVRRVALHGSCFIERDAIYRPMWIILHASKTSTGLHLPSSRDPQQSLSFHFYSGKSLTIDDKSIDKQSVIDLNSQANIVIKNDEEGSAYRIVFSIKEFKNGILIPN